MFWIKQGYQGATQYLLLFLHTCSLPYVFVHAHAHNTYLHTYIPTYIHTYLHTYMHTYVHGCIHTQLHRILTYLYNTLSKIYIYMYIHTCISQYICTRAQIEKNCVCIPMSALHRRPTYVLPHGRLTRKSKKKESMFTLTFHYIRG